LPVPVAQLLRTQGAVCVLIHLTDGIDQILVAIRLLHGDAAVIVLIQILDQLLRGLLLRLIGLSHGARLLLAGRLGWDLLAGLLLILLLTLPLLQLVLA